MLQGEFPTNLLLLYGSAHRLAQCVYCWGGVWCGGHWARKLKGDKLTSEGRILFSHILSCRIHFMCSFSRRTEMLLVQQGRQQKKRKKKLPSFIFFSPPPPPIKRFLILPETEYNYYIDLISGKSKNVSYCIYQQIRKSVNSRPFDSEWNAVNFKTACPCLKLKGDQRIQTSIFSKSQ